MPRLLAALLAALLLAPAAALADGDPASDVLLGESVFYPYQPPVTRSIQQALNAETLAAKRAGFPIKVALIQSPIDLGVIPDLFGKPQKYADFLDQEISFQTRQPLLVVMSAGFGVQGIGAKGAAAVAGLARPTGTSSNALASAAIGAVRKLADATGHPIVRSKSSSGGSSTAIVVVLAVAAGLTAIALAVITLRRRRAAA